MHSTPSAPDVQTQSIMHEDAPHPHAVALANDLSAAFRATQVRIQKIGGERPLSACLILERWQNTTLGDWLGEHLPEVATARVAVADPVYKDREDAAPCIVPLPEDWALPEPASDAARALHKMLPHWLEQAWFASCARLRPVHFCGVAFTTRDATSLAVHSAQMTFQYSPLDGAAYFFRHFDPRVMQRAWPTLDAGLRRIWLGPALAHWSLEQPWGPWLFDDMVALDAYALAHRPRGVVVTTPETEPNTTAPDRQHLFDRHQWLAALSAPIGNRLWAEYAENAIAPEHQPSGEVMSNCIDLGARLGLSGSNLGHFAAASWNLPATDGRPAWATPWEQAPYAGALQRTIAQLRNSTPLHFANLWLEQRPTSPPQPASSGD